MKKKALQFIIVLFLIIVLINEPPLDGSAKNLIKKIEAKEHVDSFLKELASDSLIQRKVDTVLVLQNEISKNREVIHKLHIK